MSFLAAATVFGSLLPWIREYHLHAWERYQTSGDLARLNSQFDESQAFYRAALIEARKLGDKKRLATSTKELGKLNEILVSVDNKSGKQIINLRNDSWIWQSAVQYQTLLQRMQSQKKWIWSLTPFFDAEVQSAKGNLRELVELSDAQMEMTGFDLAKKLLDSANELSALNGDHSLDLEILDRLAKNAYAQRNYKSALDYLDKALDKTTGAAGLEKVRIYFMLSKAQVFAEDEKSEKAIDLCHQISNLKNFMDPRQTWYLNMVLSQSESQLGHHDLALPLAEKSAADAPGLFGDKSPLLNWGYENLAEVLIRAGRRNEAYPLFEKIFELRNEQLNQNKSKRLLLIKEEAARIILKKQDIADALCKWAVEIRAKEVGPNFRPTKCLWSHLKEVYEAAGQEDKAKECQRNLDEFLKKAGK